MKQYKLFLTAGLVLLSVSSLSAQPAKTPPVTTAFAKLLTSIDSKTASKGDEVLLTTTSDIAVQGTIVIPKGAKLFGHLAGVINRGKDEPKSVIAVAINKAVVKDVDIPLQAIIAAIAAPQKPASEDPAYGMMHSNEPKMAGSARGTATTGSLPASSKANSTAAVATAELKGRGEETTLLTETSQGAYGYEDVSISWHLTLPPPLTIFATKAKRLKLESGTQMLLRMVPPSVR